MAGVSLHSIECTPSTFTKCCVTQQREQIPSSRAMWIHKRIPFYSAQPDTICETADTGPVHRVVRTFTPQLSLYSLHPRMNGQVKLTWVVGYIPRRFSSLQTVNHPSTNPARRRSNCVDQDERDKPSRHTMLR